jgi:hypothetical protein
MLQLQVSINSPFMLQAIDSPPLLSDDHTAARPSRLKVRLVTRVSDRLGDGLHPLQVPREALATWPVQFQSKHRKKYQEECCRAQGQGPRPSQRPRRRQTDLFGARSGIIVQRAGRLSYAVLIHTEGVEAHPTAGGQGVQCALPRVHLVPLSGETVNFRESDDYWLFILDRPSIE